MIPIREDTCLTNVFLLWLRDTYDSFDGNRMKDGRRMGWYSIPNINGLPTFAIVHGGYEQPFRFIICSRPTTKIIII
jgi:hypothetical protein